jgi:hypothetical protein
MTLEGQMAFGNEIWGGRLTRTRNQDAIEGISVRPPRGTILTV